MAFFVDDLKGATTSLASWAPDTGTSWTRIWNSGAVGELQVVASGVRNNGNAGDTGSIYTADATYPSANYEVEATFVATFNTITPLYLLARVADQENMYAVRLVSGASGAQLYKKVAGTWSTLGSAVTIADGSVVKLSVNGTAIKVYDDGVAVVEVTDSDLSAAGKAGLAHGGGAELVTSTDDVRAAVMVHTFSVTDLGGGGGAISGASTGTTTASATLTGAGALAGTASAVASPTATLAGAGALAGASAGQATASAAATGAGALAGASDGLATAAGTLVGAGALAGTSDGLATATGTLTQPAGAGDMAGTSAGIATAAGTLVGAGALAGAAAGLGATTATLTGEGAMAGSAAGAGTAAALLIGLGALAGNAAGAAATTALLMAYGALSGSAAGTSEATLNNDPDVIGLVALTLAARSQALTLETRSPALTLHTRSTALTLPDR